MWQDLKEESSAFVHCCCLLQISLKSFPDDTSEKVVSAIYAFLDVHTPLANYGLVLSFCHAPDCIVMVELGNFHPNPSSSSTPSFGYASWEVTHMSESVCADLFFVNLSFKYWQSKCTKLHFSSFVIC